jgi:hypothetical protein
MRRISGAHAHAGASAGIAQEITMNAIQSRRRFLGVLSAGAASAIAPAAVAATLAPAAEVPFIAPVPALASPSPDAALQQLFDEYMSTVAEYRRAYGLYERGRDQHQARHPMPKTILVQPGDAELGLPEVPEIDGEPLSYRCRIYELRSPTWSVVKKAGVFTTTGREVEFLDEEFPSAAACARADQIVAAYDRWHPKYSRYPREVRSLERQADRASKQKDKLRAKIDRRRAYTVAGLAVKAQVAAIEGEEDTQFADTTLESILRDIRKLNRAAQS